MSIPRERLVAMVGTVINYCGEEWRVGAVRLFNDPNPLLVERYYFLCRDRSVAMVPEDALVTGMLL